MRATSLLLLCAALAAAPGAAAAPARPAQGETQLQLPIHEWRLDNGLRVLFAPHRRVPAVTVQVWYRVGSKDERPGIRGIAHMFEHMMFKGSRHVRPEEHAKLISAIGGSTNAFTSADVTAYHATLPRQYLDFGLQLEAERMRNLLLTEQTIRSEREVVKEEKRARMENSPIGRVVEAIHALAFEKHPYAWTPAGKLKDLDQVSRGDCERFYARYYTPSNATLVVVGDVSEAAVREAVARRFGGIPRGAEPPRVRATEPPQQRLREQRADWPSQLAVVLGAYHVPAAAHADIPALSAAAAVLSTGRRSRLHQALVRSKKAVQAGGFLWEREHPGLLMIYGIGLPTHELDTMRATLLAEVQRLATTPVLAAELARAKNQLATRHLQQLETAWGVAYQIGNSALIQGDPRAFLGEVQRIDAVTPADVQRVVSSYLRPENLSLVLLPARSRGADGAAKQSAQPPAGAARVAASGGRPGPAKEAHR